MRRRRREEEEESSEDSEGANAAKCPAEDERERGASKNTHCKVYIYTHVDTQLTQSQCVYVSVPVSV